MPVLRAIARPMLASIFAIQGFDTLLHPERVAPRAEPVVRPVADLVPAVLSNTEQAVRINGAVQVVAASLLAVGKLPRLSALAIAATLVPTTLAGHRFWEAEDDKDRAQQRIHFLKNVSMLGGLLIAAGDTAGRPSLAWRGRHAARTARREVALAKRSGKAGAKAGATAGPARRAPAGGWPLTGPRRPGRADRPALARLTRRHRRRRPRDEGTPARPRAVAPRSRRAPRESAPRGRAGTGQAG
jgi:putative oxidoreductase